MSGTENKQLDALEVLRETAEKAVLVEERDKRRALALVNPVFSFSEVCKVFNGRPRLIVCSPIFHRKRGIWKKNDVY